MVSPLVELVAQVWFCCLPLISLFYFLVALPIRIICSLYLASKGDEFIEGLRSFGLGIGVREAELRKIRANKDAMTVDSDAMIVER